MSNSIHTILQEIVNRETRSFVQYVRDVYPWTTSGKEAELDIIRDVVISEQEAIAKLTQYMFRNRIPLPYPGSYPAVFTSMNFVSAEFVARKMIAEEEQLIKAMSEDSAHLNDEPAQLVANFLELKKANLSRLQSLNTKAEPAA